ncbi:MAG: ferrous iron transport protein A [Verrucomicrobia bacterium]|nr:MAG: ferrous iron transport protein A [Verrucomicrobiota bacterium]
MAGSRRFDLKSSLSFPSVPVLIMATASSTAYTIPLSRLPAGFEGRVHRLEGNDAQCQRLREIGFCESAVISRIGGEQSLVCKVCGARVAVHKMLADSIHVEPLFPGA